MTKKFDNRQSRIARHEETEVIVVGAGPVGSALAGDLGTRAVNCMLVEATNGSLFDPRLHAVNLRTMELARRWGIEEELRNCGWPRHHSQDIVYVTSIAGKEIGRIEWPAISDMQAPTASPTFAQRCPQTWFNPILQGFAKRQRSVQTCFENRLESFEQDQSGVTAWIRDLSSGELWSARSRYLIACDGARSEIRDQLGIKRTYASKLGYSAEIVFRSPALARLNGTTQAGRYNIVQATGMSKSMLPIDGIDLYRMTLIAEGSPITREGIIAAIHESIGSDKVAFELVNDVIPWVSGVTTAETFRRGCVFLAGDAAHTMPTTGGMGMNTGILDALDLSWKLHALCRGWGGPILLESYEIERRLAADRTSTMASAIYQDWLALEPELQRGASVLHAETPEGAAYRRALGQQLANVFRREFNSVGGALGYRYSGSPICVPDGSPEPEDSLSLYIPVSRPGHRAPHLWVTDGVSTIDWFGSGFCILHHADATGQAGRIQASAMDSKVPAELRQLPDGARVLYPADVTIVRPDGHVAWRGSHLSGPIWEILAGRRRLDTNTDKSTATMTH
jgi:2-polyprenyl-6-methoxyphenol hydroxylase-like FAD-dependent oxidoreductase